MSDLFNENSAALDALQELAVNARPEEWEALRSYLGKTEKRPDEAEINLACIAVESIARYAFIKRPASDSVLYLLRYALAERYIGYNAAVPDTACWFPLECSFAADVKTHLNAWERKSHFDDCRKEQIRDAVNDRIHALIHYDGIGKIVGKARDGSAAEKEDAGRHISGLFGNAIKWSFISDIRASKRYKVFSLDEPRDDDSVHNRAFMPADRHAPNAERAIIAKELCQKLQHALIPLDEKYKSVLNLYFSLNADNHPATYSQISESLNLPMGTVKSRVERGLQQLSNRQPGLIKDIQQLTSDERLVRMLAKSQGELAR